MPARKILLVDDEPYVTSIVSAKLRKVGDDVRTAGDGAEAFALATADVPALVVTDYQMPGTDGFALATLLRADPRTADVPVIMLTARGHLLTPTQLAQTGIRAVLAKPFSTRELLTHIDDLIGPADPAAAEAA